MSLAILDLDSTLIYSSIGSNGYSHGYKQMPSCTLRPYAIKFVLKLSQLMPIVLFSTGRDKYVKYCLATHLQPIEHCFVMVLSNTNSVESKRLFGKCKHSSYVKSQLPQICTPSSVNLFGIDDQGMVNMDEDGYHFIHNIKPFYGANVSRDNSLKKSLSIIKRKLAIVENMKIV
jgi:NLI interacting factor-like phosphatase